MPTIGPKANLNPRVVARAFEDKCYIVRPRAVNRRRRFAFANMYKAIIGRAVAYWDYMHMEIRSVTNICVDCVTPHGNVKFVGSRFFTCDGFRGAMKLD